MRRKLLWAAVAALAVLHGLDLLTTYLAITRTDAEEQNPLMAAVLERYGWPGMAASKAAVVGLTVAIVCLAVRTRDRSAACGVAWGVGVSIPIMALVVALNLRFLLH